MHGQELAATESAIEPVLLHPEEPSSFEESWLCHFNRHVVGQELAKKTLVRMLLDASHSWRSKKFPIKPAGAILLLGPSGTGKNELVRALALGLCGEKDALTRIDCGNYSEAHNVSNIVGTTKGYIGYDQDPEITQWEIDKYGYMHEQHAPTLATAYADIQRRLSGIGRQIKKATGASKSALELQRIDLVAKKRALDDKHVYKPGTYRGILLFDEAEKAHKNFYRLHYTMLDEAYLKLNSSPSDSMNPVLLHNTVICYTANIAAEKISALMSGQENRYGFGTQARISGDSRDKSIYRAALKETREFFPPAFLRRIGKEHIVVCHPLTRDQLQEILQRFIIEPFRAEARRTYYCDIVVTPNAFAYLLDESSDEVNRDFGAGAVHNVFRHHVENAILNLGNKKADEGGLIPGSIVEIILTQTSGKKRLAYLLHPGAWQGASSEKNRLGKNSQPKESLMPRIFRTFDI